MSEDIKIAKLAEAWIEGSLGEQELLDLELKLATDPEFAAVFYEQVELVMSMVEAGKYQQFSSMLQDVHHEVVSKQPKRIPIKTFWQRPWLKTAAIAAGVSLFTALVTIWVLQSNPVVRTNSSYHTLVNIQQDIARIKNAQHQQGLTINKIRDTLERMGPDAEINASGTAFALSNNGYLITNYHVVNGADSVYIRTSEGRFYKTFTIAYDATADIAILRVEKQDFKFGKTEVPYRFAPEKSPLGARIFTLGYPQEEVVYNEGYVSARNGFRGNTDQYRLDLPANPGQSGAPVFDAHGNVIGIVTAHETEKSNVTYAVSTHALHSLLETLPGELDIQLPKTSRISKLSREQQIEKLQQFTFMVQVYK